MKYDAFFYEAFAEEADALKQFLPKNLRVGFDAGTIQECAHHAPLAPVISIRTQSQIPVQWSDTVQVISGFFSYEKLSSCKPGALFINIARGELSPAPDLLRLLQEQRLGGVGLDVYDEEKDLAVALRNGREPQTLEAKAILSMSALPNVICTPHNAFNTIEAVQRKSEQTAMQIESLRTTGRLLWHIPLGD